jgi:uncharacterized protein (DUF1499 family)
MGLSAALSSPNCVRSVVTETRYYPARYATGADLDREPIEKLVQGV